MNSLVITPQHWWFFAAGIALALLMVVPFLFIRSQRREAQDATAINELRAQLDAERRIGEERRESFESAKRQTEAVFAHLSQRALQVANADFLRLAEQKLKHFEERGRSESEKREQAVAGMIKPIREALRKTEDQIRDIEKERREAVGALREQLSAMATDQQSLRQETRNLVQALRRPEVRGRWGELTLRRLVEIAGMVEHCDFREQPSSGDGLRPDMVIELPDDRQLVIDVKTPLDAYLSAQEARTDAEREQRLRQHTQNLRSRVKRLADKQYWEQFSQSPDFVILFVPGEQFLTAALDHDQQLFEQALRSRVILATPTSLIALLRAVAFSWRQVAMIKNAEQIRDAGESLLQRISIFSEHFARLGKAIGAAADSYNQTRASVESRLLPAAKRLSELGIADQRETHAPPTIDSKPQVD